jgi:predicted lactoylglutathione lyase
MPMNVICPVFISNNVKRTLEYYTKILGFKYADHTNHEEKFATIYRDSIEIIIVEKNKGEIESNTSRYGNGDDAYICPDTIESVDEIYNEFIQKGVKIINKPELKSYGSYEFTIEDVDGRHIGIGRIKEQSLYFKKSDYK